MPGVIQWVDWREGRCFAGGGGGKTAEPESNMTVWWMGKIEKVGECSAVMRLCHNASAMVTTYLHTSHFHF